MVITRVFWCRNNVNDTSFKVAQVVISSWNSSQIVVREISIAISSDLGLLKVL